MYNPAPEKAARAARLENRRRQTNPHSRDLRQPPRALIEAAFFRPPRPHRSRAASSPEMPASSFSPASEYVKQTGKKNFLIVDAAMNDLIRPSSI